jgi:hypothetical protein
LTASKLIPEGLKKFAKRWIARRRAFRTTSKLLAKDNVVYVKGKEMLATGERTAVIKEDKKALVARHTDHLRKVYTHSRRLKRAWRNHVVLLSMDVNAVPQPFQMQIPSKNQRGFIAMEDLAVNGEELDTFLDRTYDHLGYRARIKMVKGFSDFLTKLFGAGIGHRDMKACNFFFLHDGGFRLLDVEDICFQRVDRTSALRMFRQLNMSVPKRVSLADRLRFFSLVTQGASFDRKELLRAVVSESRKGRIQYVGVGGTVSEQWEQNG